MKTLLAWVGGIMVVLALLGSLGIGNFVLMCDPDRITCAREATK